MTMVATRPMFCLLVFCTAAYAQLPRRPSVRVAIEPTLEALIADEDTDGDKNITIDDPRVPGTTRGDKRFVLRASDGRPFEIAGTYPLSNLLAELKIAQESGNDSVALAYHEIFEAPVEHIARCIKSRYWKGLTRTIDEEGLPHVFRDEKSRSSTGVNYVYVPHDDSVGAGYFQGVARRHPDWHMEIVALPATITAEFVRALDGRHGILALGLQRNASGTLQGVPFVVPGGRFNELYGWDSYFIVLGLLHDGHYSLARSMVDNLVYEITHYGKILNANRTYYLTRSQPPFLTSMARAVYERLPRSMASKRWLTRVIEAAILEYDNVWMGRERLTETGLSRYDDSGIGPPPEVEAGRFDSLFAHAARDHGVSPAEFRDGYTKGVLHSSRLDEVFRHDRAMRESGHDASYRLLDNCADLVTVDLNSLLYKAESDIAEIIAREFNGSVTLGGTIQRAGAWRERARARRELMTRFLWNEREGMFFDYDVVTRHQTPYQSATTLYPLWAGLASGAQAARIVASAVPLLAMPGGIAASTEQSRGQITPVRPQTQWDYPFGWAPHQMLAWSGLRRYHYDRLARDLAYRWLYMLTLNACNYNGTIAEKYDVVSRSAQVFAEYGNVGTKFSYITREGFGWTNASFVVARALLNPRQLEDLNRWVAPEWHHLRWGKED